MATRQALNMHSNGVISEKWVGFRDELVEVLDHQIDLLNEMQSLGLVPSHQEDQYLVIDEKHLPEMIHLLEGEKFKLQNFDVILAVVGTMKAGKSTTINAIVGKEIMPNRNRPMTAVPTLICHKKGQIEPVMNFDNRAINALLNQIQLFLEKNPDRQVLLQPELQKLCEDVMAGYRFDTHYTGSEQIFTVLAKFNDLVRLTEVLDAQIHFPFNCYRDIHQLPLIEVEFAYLKGLAEGAGRLMLLDTPGPNEAKQPHLKVMMEEQLKRSSAVVLVLDYTQLKSEAEEEVRTQLTRLPRIDEGRLYAVVNKFDQKDTHADDEQMTKKLVANDLLAGRVNIDRVYPISARDAYLANRLVDYMRTYREKPMYAEDSWVADFAKKAFGEVDAQEWSEYSNQVIIKRIQRLLQNSNIQKPMEQVVMSASINAPYLAICSALVDVDKVFNDIKNVFSINGYFSRQVELNEQDLRNIKRAIVKMQIDQAKVSELSAKLTSEFKESLVDLKVDLDHTTRRIFLDVEIQTKMAIAKLSEEMAVSLQEAQQKYQKATSLSGLLRSLAPSNLTSNGYAQSVTATAKRREAAAGLAAKEDASSGLGNQAGKVLTLSEEDKEIFVALMSDVTRGLSVMASDTANQAVQAHLNLMYEGLAGIQEEYRKSFDNIKRRFSDEGIDLNMELPSYFSTTQRAITNLEMSDAVMQSETHTRVVEQAGLLGKIKRAIASPFSADWGTDDVQYQLYNIDLNKVAKQIAMSIQTMIIKPIIEEAEFDVGIKSEAIDDYANQVQRQVDSLINELQTAIDHEQLPYSQKARRKEKLNRIAKQNFKVEGRIQVIKDVFMPK